MNSRTLLTGNMSKLQRQPKSKKPDLDEMEQIIGETRLPDGNTLPTGYCIWKGKKFMYLGKRVDGEWRRYGNQNTVWYTRANDWPAIQRWLAKVHSKWFLDYYGTDNPPTEEERIYAPMPK